MILDFIRDIPRIKSRSVKKSGELGRRIRDVQNEPTIEAQERPGMPTPLTAHLEDSSCPVMSCQAQRTCSESEVGKEISSDNEFPTTAKWGG